MSSIVRILLDTGIVRNLMHGNGDQLPCAALTRHGGVAVSIADGAFAELLEQFVRGSIAPQDWSRGIGLLEQVLDKAWPVFPGGRELASLCGTRIGSDESMADSQAYYQAVWRLIRSAQGAGDLAAGVTYATPDGRYARVRLDEANLAAVMQRERASWTTFIEAMAAVPSPTVTRQDADEAVWGTVGAGAADPPDLKERLRGPLKAIAQFVQMSWKATGPYNPRSEGRRGDTFDMTLLFALPLPAIVVTTDTALINRLRQTGIKDLQRVISAPELEAHLHAGTLHALVGA